MSDDFAGTVQPGASRPGGRKAAICRGTGNQAESEPGKQAGSPHHSLTGAESRRTIRQECSISHATECVALP